MRRLTARVGDPGLPLPTWPLLSRMALLVGGLAFAAPAPLQAQDELTVARSDFFTGAYEEALARVEPLSAGGEVAAIELHARILSEVGRYDEALELLRGQGGFAPAPELEVLKGELHFEVGEWEDAEAAWERAEGRSAPARSTARLRLGELEMLRGDWPAAVEYFDALIDRYNERPGLPGDEILAVATAAVHLGRETPSLFQDALRAFDEAAGQLPDGDPRPRVATGDLFLSKYSSTQAYDEYAVVLDRNPRHPDALYGRARAQHFDNAPGALATAEAVLETNPNHVGALTLIAEMRLQAENVPLAVEAAERALAVNPRSLDALGTLAATWFVAGNVEESEAVRRRAEAFAPSWPGTWVRMARLSADSRKYSEAVRFAQRAVELDPLDWEARGIVGMNQLRTARIEEGRRNLEAAFEGDPYNPWFKNTLDLLDLMDDFGSVSTEHFEIVLPADEVELLGPRAAAVAEEAFAALVERYGAEPPTPIRLEIFGHSEDFSVRTLGMVGMGALGVSFGSTLVMDSPTARAAGEFNWASTLWHEIAHAFHLAISDHEVPRWFSEGLAVREQRVARPDWGYRASVPFLQVWAAGRMPPLSRLNEAFVRPAFPEQVPFGYFQGSLAFDWIEDRWGLQTIRDFLTGYRDGRTTGELTRDLLGLDDDELDAAFEAWVRERYATQIASTAPTGSVDAAGGAGAGTPSIEELLGGASLDDLESRARSNPGSFPARLAYGQALVRAERWDAAEEELRAAQRLFPGYPGLDGPLAGLARVHEGRGELREAADALRALRAISESGWSVAVREAELRRELGDLEGEYRALLKAAEIQPFVMETHARLGEVAAELEAWEDAIAARRAVIALGPTDRAQAHFELARAYWAVRDSANARSAVLRALEIAPTFDAALDLLLEIRGGTR